MARYIDAELFADRLLNAWTTADKEKKSEIVAILSDIVTPILVGTPTADVAPRAEVAREIFEEIEDLMREWFDFFRQDNDIRESCAIMAALSQITELKKKYTEGGK